MKSINILVFLVIASLTPGVVSAQSKMLMTEYDAHLQTWKAREDSARAVIQELSAGITAEQQEIQQVEAENSNIWQEIYELIDADANQVAEFRQKIQELKQEVEEFSQLSKEDQKKNQLEINRKISQMHKSKTGALTDVHERLGELEKKMVILNLMLR